MNDWLKMVRMQSSRKAPLPKMWHTLPFEQVVELALERGWHGGDSRIEAVKFLRDWTKEHAVF